MLSISATTQNAFAAEILKLELTSLAERVRKQQPEACSKAGPETVRLLLEKAVVVGRKLGLVLPDHVVTLFEGMLLLDERFYDDEEQFPSIVKVLHNQALAPARKNDYLSEILIFHSHPLSK